MIRTCLSGTPAVRRQPWLELLIMADDAALLQETCNPPVEVQERMEFSPYDPWLGGDRFSLNELRPLRVVKLVHPRESRIVRAGDAPAQVAPSKLQIAVSGVGTCAAARVTPLEGNREPFIVVSMHASWHGPQSYHRRRGNLICMAPPMALDSSGLSIFVPAVYGPQSDVGSSRHLIMAAGDLNVSFRSSDAFHVPELKPSSTG